MYFDHFEMYEFLRQNFFIQFYFIKKTVGILDYGLFIIL